jgi:hypothetical protein
VPQYGYEPNDGYVPQYGYEPQDGYIAVLLTKEVVKEEKRQTLVE